MRRSSSSSSSRSSSTSSSRRKADWSRLFQYRRYEDDLSRPFIHPRPCQTLHLLSYGLVQFRAVPFSSVQFSAVVVVAVVVVSFFFRCFHCCCCCCICRCHCCCGCICRCNCCCVAQEELNASPRVELRTPFFKREQPSARTRETEETGR